MPTVPLLASVADLSASQIAGAASQLVPSGVVMAFAGATAPSGWLLCNGSLINRTTYSDLFTAIGTAHGSGDGSTTFALPNYAGQFLRGRANGSANDPDRASRTAAATGGNAGDLVGSLQTTATKRPTSAMTGSVSGTVGGSDGTHSHTHAQYLMQSNSASLTQADSSAGGGAAMTGTVTTTQTISSTSSGHGHTHSLSTTINAGGDNESRPPNAYVNYIIKI